jgi:hypothetical protein
MGSYSGREVLGTGHGLDQGGLPDPRTLNGPTKVRFAIVVIIEIEIFFLSRFFFAYTELSIRPSFTLRTVLINFIESESMVRSLENVGNGATK